MYVTTVRKNRLKYDGPIYRALTGRLLKAPAGASSSSWSSTAVSPTPPIALDADCLNGVNCLSVCDPRSSHTFGVRCLSLVKSVCLQHGDEVTVIIHASPPTSRLDQVSPATKSRRTGGGGRRGDRWDKGTDGVSCAQRETKGVGGDRRRRVEVDSTNVDSADGTRGGRDRGGGGWRGRQCPAV